MDEIDEIDEIEREIISHDIGGKEELIEGFNNWKRTLSGYRSTVWPKSMINDCKDKNNMSACEILCKKYKVRPACGKISDAESLKSMINDCKNKNNIEACKNLCKQNVRPACHLVEEIKSMVNECRVKNNMSACKNLCKKYKVRPACQKISDAGSLESKVSVQISGDQMIPSICPPAPLRRGVSKWIAPTDPTCLCPPGMGVQKHKNTKRCFREKGKIVKYFITLGENYTKTKFCDPAPKVKGVSKWIAPTDPTCLCPPGMGVQKHKNLKRCLKKEKEEKKIITLGENSGISQIAEIATTFNKKEGFSNIEFTRNCCLIIFILIIIFLFKKEIMNFLK